MRAAIVFAFVSIVSFSVCGQSILFKADSLIAGSQADRALSQLDEHLKLIRDAQLVSRINIKKAEAYISLQQYSSAQSILEQEASQKPTGTLLGSLRLTEGMLQLYLGNNSAAEEALTEAEKIFNVAGSTPSFETAKALTYLGLVYFNSGKFSQAEELLLLALAVRQKLLPETHEFIAASYNDLGLVYSKSNPDKALTYYEKALPIYKKIYGSVHPKIAINNSNTGVIYQNLELYGDAVNNLEESLRTWEQLSAQPNPQKAFVLFQLGYTYQKMQNNNSAGTYYKRALEEYKKCYGNTHPDIAGVLNALGNLERSEDRHDEALLSYHQAIQANSKKFTAKNLTAIPDIEQFYNGNYLLYSLMYKAQTWEARHLEKTLKFSDLTAALKHLMVCDSLIDKLRQQSTNEADKISLGTIAHEVYADGVRIATHMSGIAPSQRKRYRELAFYFAEKSKSAVLLEAISDTNAKSFAGIPDELLQKEQTLKSDIALCAQKLSQKPTPDEETVLRELLFNNNKQYQAFTKQLEQQYPEYFNLKFNTATPSIATLQQKLDAGTVMLSYFIDDSKTDVAPYLYIFLISNKKLTITARALPKDFDKFVTGFRNGIYYQVTATATKTGYDLANILLPDVPRTIKSLVIFPTGRLGVIPFEALVTSKVKEGSKPHYLVEDYAIRYEFSAALALQKRQITNQNKSILLCAPVTFDEKDNLSDLPGTEQEVNAISKLFTDQATPRVLLNSDANESAVKSNTLADYNLLHFATHGVVDEAHPELSRIYLQHTTGTDDGYLFSGEIYNLKLNAALVTLSACQTGLGKISKGEGVIGLSRALAYAGANNIMVSFWSVADQSTAQLMTDFYSNILNNDVNFSASLRQVKLNMLQHPTYNAPYYWAAFVLIGF